MKISYKFIPEISINESFNLNKVSDADLFYDSFEGDVFFSNETSGHELVFDGITIYDFILNFKNTLNELEHSSNSEIDFTESDLIVSFKKRDELVEIFSELTELSIEVGFEELKASGNGFIKSFCKDLIRFYPNNETYKFIFDKLDLKREDLTN
ncbi:MAG: hypothetical protein BalsKO_25390 [Balneolaceae bacterium]